MTGSPLDTAWLDRLPEPGAHPSDHQLEQLLVDAAAVAGVAAHLERCADCQQRMQTLRAEQQAFYLQLPASRILSRLPQPRPAAALWRGWRWLLSGAALAAAATSIWLVWLPDQPPVDADRVKGGAALVVGVQRGERLWQARSGEGLAAGDRLQLQLTAPGSGQLRVLGRVGDRVAPQLPAPGDAAYAAGYSVIANRPFALPESLLLDAEPRPEWLIMVLSDRPLAPDAALRLASALDPAVTTGWVELAAGVQALAFEITRRRN